MNYHICRLVLSSFCVGAFAAASIWWCSFCRLKPAKRTPPNTSRSKSSNTQRTENKTTDVVIHQHSRKLLKMDILMSETCWAHKWNKMTSSWSFILQHLFLVDIGQMGWGEWKKWREDGSLDCHYPLSAMRPHLVSSEQQEVGIGKICSM